MDQIYQHFIDSGLSPDQARANSYAASNALPLPYDIPNYTAPGQVDTFGDTAVEMMREPWAQAKADWSQAGPSGRGLLAGGSAGLNALMAGLGGGAGLLSEAMPDIGGRGADQNELAFARDFMGFGDAYAGAGIGRGMNALDDLVDAGADGLAYAGRGAADVARRSVDAIPSDVMYAGRSLAEGDMRGVLDAFTPSRPAQSLSAGAAAPFDIQNAPLASIPRLEPKDLLDARIIPTVADLTRTGGYYTGIDASKIDVPEPMMGGPGYPLLPSSQQAGLAWAVQGKHIGTKKAGSGADLIAVTAMNPQSHRSNISVSNALIKTTKAFARDGRIPRDALSELDTAIWRSGFGGDASLAGLGNFPGFGSSNLDEWIKGATFPERSRVADIIASKDMQARGLPNVNRVLQETVDTKFAGANPRDTLLFIEPDFSLPPVDLWAEGMPTHPSYRYGIRGRVYGALDQNISTFEMFPDYWGEKNINAFGPGFNTGGRRGFDLGLPLQDVTGRQVEELERILQSSSNMYPASRLSPIDTRITTNSMLNRWKPTNQSVKSGGASPQAFVDAIENNKYKPALTNYSAADIKAGSKSGDLVAYQLGDDDVFFAIDSKPDYSWAGVEAQPGDKALVGVVSNAPGAKGTAAPSVLAKAIEEGATVLDAFAVPSQRFPGGFLPTYYKKFGFEEAGRVPFDEKMYISDHGEQAFKNLKAAWQSDGWDESMGMPPVIVMRWSGTDADRAATAAGIRGAGAPSYRAEPEGIIPEARGLAGRGSERPVSVEPPSDGRGTAGGIGNGNRVRLTTGAGEDAKGLLGLTPQQLRNKGISSEQIDEITQMRKNSGLLSIGAQ